MVNATAASMASIAAVGGPYVAAALEARGGNLLQLTALSAVYLAGLLVGPVVVERHARGRGLYFACQLALTAILLAQVSRTMAIAPLALISQAVLYLRPRSAAVVIGAVVGATLGPVWISSSEGVVALSVNYLTAVVFVIGFSVIAANHYDQRERATRLANELTVAYELLRESRHQVAELASAQERSRIAQEVHDGLGHTLTVAHIQLEAAREVVHRDADRAAQIIARVQAVVQAGLRDVRSSVGLLRDETRPRALTEAIEEWASELRAEGLTVALDLASGTPSSAATAHVMYRAAQEAVTNVRRHARAGAVEIAITRTAAWWRLRVADDGRGTSAGIDRGFGLTGIRSRVASAGGHVEIQTRAGGGFALTLDLPTTPVEIGARA